MFFLQALVHINFIASYKLAVDSC